MQLCCKNVNSGSWYSIQVTMTSCLSQCRCVNDVPWCTWHHPLPQILCKKNLKLVVNSLGNIGNRREHLHLFSWGKQVLCPKLIERIFKDTVLWPYMVSKEHDDHSVNEAICVMCRMTTWYNLSKLCNFHRLCGWLCDIPSFLLRKLRSASLIPWHNSEYIPGMLDYK